MICLYVPVILWSYDCINDPIVSMNGAMSVWMFLWLYEFGIMTVRMFLWLQYGPITVQMILWLY